MHQIITLTQNTCAKCYIHNILVLRSHAFLSRLHLREFQKPRVEFRPDFNLFLARNKKLKQIDDYGK